jgi:hypothetical protein
VCPHIFSGFSLDIAGEKMKFMNVLGLGVTAGLLAAACGSSNTPASSGTATTGATSGSTVATGASTGTTTTGSSAGAASGTTATAGTSSGSATMPEASTTEEASADTDSSSAADAATSASALVAVCNANGVYHTSPTGTAFEAQDFCTLFISICSQYVAVTALSVQATCEMTYAGWTTAQQECRTDHLCNAAGSTADETMHCWHAQGYAAPVSNGASALAGGPCP